MRKSIRPKKMSKSRKSRKSRKMRKPRKISGTPNNEEYVNKLINEYAMKIRENPKSALALLLNISELLPKMIPDLLHIIKNIDDLEPILSKIDPKTKTKNENMIRDIMQFLYNYRPSGK